MELNVGIISSLLSVTPQIVCGHPDHPLSLSDIRALTPGNTLYSEEILYFAEWPVWEQIAGELPTNGICLGGGKRAADFFEVKGMTGIILEDQNPTIVFGIIQSIFLRYNKLEHRLMEALLLKSPIKEILNCCSELLLNHVMLFDGGFNLIDYGTNYMPNDNDALWRETLSTQKVANDLYQWAKKMTLSHDPIVSPKSELVEPGDNIPRSMINSFYDSNRRIASLVIVETCKPLSSCHLKLLDYISMQIGPILNDRYAALFSSVENLRSVFVMILNKVNVDPRVVSRCLSPWKSKDDYLLILINLPEDSRDLDTLTRYMYIYEDIFPECVAFKYVESLVLIIHNDTAEVMKECIPKLEKQLLMHNAVSGVSLPFNSILQINSQFINTSLAIKHGDKTKPIRYLKDVFTNYLINKIANETPLIPLCNREVMRIYDYDRENGTELLLTLETYLRQNKSLKAAAEELFIHRNTLTYRLGCIEDLAKIDFDDSRERLHALLSCIVLHNLGSASID